MPTTLIIRCPRCHKLLLTQQKQKTRTCPHCNTTINTERIQPIATAQNAQEASQKLKDLKAKNAETKPEFRHL